MAFCWRAVHVTGHLARGPGIFGWLCVAESPYPPNSLLYFLPSLHLSPLATCLRTTAVLCVARRVSFHWLRGRGRWEDCAAIAADNCAIMRRSRSLAARWLFAMHEALSAVTYRGTGVIQLWGWPWVVQNPGTDVRQPIIHLSDCLSN